MAHVDWMLKGPKVAGCNCAYGCPCEFNAPPTYGDCKGIEAMRVDRGWFGEVRLDGLYYASLFWWPGPVHEGRGEVQLVIDASADPAQREALLTILSGAEQEPTTPINFYSATIDVEHEPLFAPFEFACDVALRTARVRVPGVLDLALEPIRNPVTGRAHRALIVLPEGVEFKSAEMASATIGARAAANYAFSGRHGVLWETAIGPSGILDQSPV